MMGTYLLMGVLVALFQVPSAAEPLPPWQAPLGREHPLVGKVWDVGGERFLTPQETVAALATARFVLLGEKHDNPDHHRLQAWVLGELVARGRSPLVALEMLHGGQAEGLTRHLQQRPGEVEGLAHAVNWAASGWPAWEMYEPIFALAVRAALPLAPANLTPAEVRRVAAEGVVALGAERVAVLALDRPLGEAEAASLAAEIVASHCDQVPLAAVGSMVAVQRARDAVMAEALVAAGERGGVLITGAGHARRDRGVPWYLEARRASGGVGTVAFVEVIGGQDDPASYRTVFGGVLPFDFLWFTPRVDDQDPCEKFGAQLERLRARPTPAAPPAGQE